MNKELRVFAKEKTINKKDGSSVKKLEFSYTPNGIKFFDVIFQGISKPNKAGYWLAVIDDKNISPKKGKPRYDSNGNPVKRRDGRDFVSNDILFIKEVISLKFDEEYEAKREQRRQDEVNAIFALDNSLDAGEDSPF